jgi:hypothetical protein
MATFDPLLSDSTVASMVFYKHGFVGGLSGTLCLILLLAMNIGRHDPLQNKYFYFLTAMSPFTLLMQETILLNGTSYQTSILVFCILHCPHLIYSSDSSSDSFWDLDMFLVK